jgi:hypothetical protein
MAVIYLPARSAEAVTASGKPLAAGGPVKLLALRNGRAELKATTGSYHFSARN